MKKDLTRVSDEELLQGLTNPIYRFDEESEGQVDLRQLSDEALTRALESPFMMNLR